MQNFPESIRSEKDLDIYEKYIDSDDITFISKTNKNDSGLSFIPMENHNLPQSLKNSAFLPAYLSKYVGKLIRTDSFIGNRTVTKIGVLKAVGENFIVLKPYRSNDILICDLHSIKYITVANQMSDGGQQTNASNLRKFNIKNKILNE